MNKSVAFIAAAVALVAGSVIALTSTEGSAQVSATYRHGVLHVSMPYHATVEVLDPEDRVVARGNGRGQEVDVAIPGSPAVEDVAWDRLRYRSADTQGITAVSRILRRPSVHVLGQQSYITGGSAAVRLVVTEPDQQTPVAAGWVRIELRGDGRKPQVLYTGGLNPRGTTRAQFRFPVGLTGNYLLHYAVDTPLGEAEQTQAIRVEEKSSILLTTEKPVYQPGQTIHARVLVLDRASHQATGNRKLTFEAEDSRGNKLFRSATQTDDYGVASAEFVLADEVNLGTWHLRALMDDANHAELALQVERYTLPRFKVAVDLAGKDAKAKRGYRPGDHVTGTVRSNYFFGKAVDHAQVSVKASALDVALVEAAKVEGTTDGDGSFAFDMRLPDFFAGQAGNHGAARVLIEATVKDNAGHSETHGESVTVSESPLLVTAVPESGALVPGVENQVFILTSYPDGTPAQAEVRVHSSSLPDRTASTDQSGVAVVSLAGRAFKDEIRVDAKDREGSRASVPIELESRAGFDPVLLHTEQALYRAGDRVRVQVWSARERGSAYVDVIKDGQTIATHDLDLVKGVAHLEFVTTPEMAGTLELNAYVFGRDGQPSGDHRMVFVQPADELRIETTTDAQVYKPGSEARVGFRVTNRRGEGVQAALGLEVVDQAVFALAEKQPGFAKVFFYLEQEMMKPRYEIHSIGLPAVISTAEQDRAARALFSAMEMKGANDASLNFGGDAAQSKAAEYSARYRNRIRAQVERIAAQENDAVCGQLSLKLADPWGKDLQVAFRQVRSAGPDGEFNTADDIVDWMPITGCSVRVALEHNIGGRAAVAGTVTDMSGAAVQGALIHIVERATGRTHTLRTSSAGGFGLNGIASGTVSVSVSSPGFASVTKEFRLNEGDRASLSMPLQVGEVNEMVEVMAAAPMMMINGAVAKDAPMAFPKMAMRADLSVNSRALGSLALKKSAVPETHVRSWFPESLYVRPEIITDRDGRASITIPVADNITTWRMAMLASTKQGALGSGTSSLKVFQDFFTEMDLPVTLTEGDEVSIPVAVYNYTGAKGNAKLRLEPGDWFSFEGDAAEKSVTVDAGRVGGSQFSISAKRIGKFKLTLRAEMEGGSKRADIVVREIEVVPNGREQSMVFNGRLDSAVQQAVNFPAASIADANTVFVRLYPGPMSQIVEGMDSLLRMPYGCFEQTSSSTYPNVLALDYMKRTKKATPEVSAKAQGFIAAGYQRLMTFEVPGGGFSWFGNAPANKILTSYGLMEFSDMSKVHDVDPRLIQRTQQWLADQQQSDGSWRPDSGGIAEGAINRYQSDTLRITAYVAWALETSGYQGAAVDRARQFIGAHLNAASDAYTLAVVANFAVDGKDRAFIDRAIRLLLDAKAQQGDQVVWKSEETSMYGRGMSAAVETTGLAVQALLKWGGDPAVAAKAMNYIVASKDSAGTWGTTQATIMALRALLSTERGASTAKGSVEVVLNGRVAERLVLTAENNDLFHQFVFKGGDVGQGNWVEIRFTGQGSLAYQVAGRYFVPWNEKPANEALSIDVAYDRTRLEQDQIATATATVRNRLRTTANMVMVDLGIPPGFDLLSEDLDSYREKSAGKKSGRLEKFSLTPTQAILYFDSIGGNDGFKVSFRLRAKYPIRVRTFASRVYEYYDPAVSAMARPVQMEVRKR